MRQKDAAGDLTPVEQNNVRVILHYLHREIRDWQRVADALNFKRGTIADAAGGRGSVSASLAIRVARLVGVTIDDVLAGRFKAAKLCPCCGRDMPEDRPRLSDS